MRLTLGKMGWGVVGTLFLISPLLAATSKEGAAIANAPAYNWAYAEEASGLLEQIRSLSTQAAEKTHLLDFASQRNQLHWRSHALELHQISQHINAMGEKLDRLQEIHGLIAPWQQKAVERVTPNAVALAVHTEEAVAYVKEHQGRLWAPSYTERVSAMSEHAEEIRNSVSAFLDYAKTSDRLKGLERQIEWTGA
ncbi:MAG TPA: hypothetical protein VMW51_00680 [Terriglobia bacterium]|nr:hypothetical protein [Terriglobia bacterium]